MLLSQQKKKKKRDPRISLGCCVSLLRSFYCLIWQGRNQRLYPCLRSIKLWQGEINHPGSSRKATGEQIVPDRSFRSQTPQLYNHNFLKLFSHLVMTTNWMGFGKHRKGSGGKEGYFLHFSSYLFMTKEKAFPIFDFQISLQILSFLSQHLSFFYLLTFIFPPFLYGSFVVA